LCLDGIVVSSNPFLSKEILEGLAQKEIHPTRIDAEEIKKMGIVMHIFDLTNTVKPLRHNPQKLAKALIDILRHKA
jgi:hypothetical protein